MTRAAFPFRIMTCADAKYFHFLPHLEANVARKFGMTLLIYDLGLTNDQIASLNSEVIRLDVPDHFRESHAQTGFIMGTHKAACIADCLERSPAGCLCVDADVLFVEALTATDFGDADVAVTPRHPRERTAHHLVNGDINSGVLFFSGSKAARRLLADWGHACDKGDRTDQKALSDLLADFSLLGTLAAEGRNGLRVLKLDPRVFNDVSIRTGRILHFKNAGRTVRALDKLRRYRRLEERHPRFLATVFRLRRMLALRHAM